MRSQIEQMARDAEARAQEAGPGSLKRQMSGLDSKLYEPASTMITKAEVRIAMERKLLRPSLRPSL